MRVAQEVVAEARPADDLRYTLGLQAPVDPDGPRALDFSAVRPGPHPLVARPGGPPAAALVKYDLTRGGGTRGRSRGEAGGGVSSGGDGGVRRGGAD